MELSDETGPAGPGGVYKLSDGATTVHSGILFNSIYGNFEADEDYTFSIWTKSGDGESHPRVYIFISEYVDDTYLGSTQMTIQDMEGDGDWKRYERTYHTVGNNGNPPNRFKIAIYPDWDVSKTGSILVWGPQLEKGEYATGYQ
ncbi:MAG: hypothetical protein GY847_36225, partial [Proteobacteria bacterium]|nr:hypothetical protein [Pseudomonadota bacterium]